MQQVYYHRGIIYTDSNTNCKNSYQFYIEVIIKWFQTYTDKKYGLQSSVQKYRNPSKVFRSIFIKLNLFFLGTELEFPHQQDNFSLAKVSKNENNSYYQIPEFLI